MFPRRRGSGTARGTAKKARDSWPAVRRVTAPGNLTTLCQETCRSLLLVENSATWFVSTRIPLMLCGRHKEQMWEFTHVTAMFKGGDSALDMMIQGPTDITKDPSLSLCSSSVSTSFSGRLFPVPIETASSPSRPSCFVKSQKERVSLLIVLANLGKRFNWPILSHVPIPGPIAVVRKMKNSNELGLSHMPSS